MASKTHRTPTPTPAPKPALPPFVAPSPAAPLSPRQQRDKDSATLERCPKDDHGNPIVNLNDTEAMAALNRVFITVGGDSGAGARNPCPVIYVQPRPLEDDEAPAAPPEEKPRA